MGTVKLGFATDTAGFSFENRYLLVIGNRRSIRFFDPDRPVEREKIQIMFEASRLASGAVNAHRMKAMVMQRDGIPEEQLEKLKAANMIQRQSVPNDPQRKAEIKKLAENYGLPL